mmetsp:Transcript_43180/g.92119  ORF Transcript_43180/g.92119 Transcript_43180/m.92119 type:complete len:233 (-) Transcript_43180:1170-1868(-)
MSSAAARTWAPRQSCYRLLGRGQPGHHRNSHHQAWAGQQAVQSRLYRPCHGSHRHDCPWRGCCRHGRRLHLYRACRGCSQRESCSEAHLPLSLSALTPRSHGRSGNASHVGTFPSHTRCRGSSCRRNRSCASPWSCVRRRSRDPHNFPPRRPCKDESCSSQARASSLRKCGRRCTGPRTCMCPGGGTRRTWSCGAGPAGKRSAGASPPGHLRSPPPASLAHPCPLRDSPGCS